MGEVTWDLGELGFGRPLARCCN